MKHEIAAIIPCYNEELTIAKVVDELKKNLPHVSIYVFDNNSTDATSENARRAGAIVIRERRQGKGYVMQSMFRDIDADIYVMVDGDDTYDLSKLENMVSLVASGEADMVAGNRLKTYTNASFRRFHSFGNQLVKTLVNVLFRSELKDIMTGLRVMNKNFVKNINIMSSGFEVETEMAIKALKYGFLIKEVDISYRERPEGSFSKLSTFRDGFKVLKTIMLIFKYYKPLIFFSLLALISFIISSICAAIVIVEFVKTNFITHLPLAVLATGSMLFSLILLAIGLILDGVNRRFDELYNFVRNKNHPCS